MITCKKCGSQFPIRIEINGKWRNLGSRKYCISCSPFGSKNTTKLVNPRPAFIDSIEKCEFEKLIKSSNNRSEIFRKLNLRKSGASFLILNRRLNLENIDISHFNIGGNHGKTKLLNSDILVENSPYHNSHNLKLRLIKDNLLKNECGECGLYGTWNKKPLGLQLDHINGIRNDNRIENLRILCPNCHSQTPTFCKKRRT